MKMNKTKGSTTVEAILIFPVIFISLILLLYASVIQYETINAMTSSVEATSFIAGNWKHMNNNTIADKSQSGFVQEMISENCIKDRNILKIYEDIYSNSEEKINLSEKILKNNLDRLSMDYYNNKNEEGWKLYKEQDFFHKTIVVELNKSYYNPISKIAKLVGINVFDKTESFIKVKSKVTDMTDFIRNVDYIGEILGR